jgi:hypothetical protein
MATRQHIANLRIFVADVGSDRRINKRFEAKIVDLLYKLPEPLCSLPDRGVSISRRWSTESPIVVHSRCKERLIGIPETFGI